MSGNTNHTENELLISRFLSKHASEAEKQQVINLLQTDDKFKEVFLSMQQTVKAVDALLFYESIDEEKALKQIYSKANIKEENTVKPRPAIQLSRILKIAGIIILGIVIAFLIQDKPKQILLSSKTSVVSENLMPDSSLIALNKNSTLQYSNKYGIKNRNIKLTGEAFFSVKKNHRLPFIVDCNGLFVEVTGTSFTINNQINSKQINVYVSSGQVKVYDNNGKQEILNLGDMVSYNRTNETLIKSHIEKNLNINSWLTRTLAFDDCPLQQVINDINNYYKADIRLDVKNMKNCRFSANFEEANLDSVLEIICLSFNLELIKDNNNLTLKGDGC
ncbi:FecR family protein [Labilibaculum sp. K2S]|uniref:FecR family protein n=1 Tax=Labilibaculum sp. K2S TaxID=3056386 RepID=UPI0025A48A56|nr:FecR family protein [Labilibaculum sp. K2S]MDM8160212.1 FecR family protein [Labilibaculum sp. K2S]